MTWTAKLAAWALGVALIFGAGMTAGWKIWGPKQAKQEVYAAPVTQQDGSQILEKKPQADAKPAQQVPKGATVERVVQVTVQPDAPHSFPGRSESDALVPADPARPPCPPVRVDLTLVRMPDLTRRVIASSPDGKVVGGVDIPVESAAPAPRPLKWAAGASWNPTNRTYGGWVQRDIGPLLVGLDVLQQRVPDPISRVTWSAQIRAGIRF